jgi:hypothetical protein
MDDRKFDTITRNWASGTSRRAVLKGFLGLGGIVAAGVELHHAGAARRGFSGPVFPGLTPTEPPCVNPDSCLVSACCSGFRCCNGQHCIPNDDICEVA